MLDAPWQPCITPAQMATNNASRLVVISGPSGTGKGSVLRPLLERAPVPLVRSVSATTRPPRQGEVDGRDYHFVSDEEFQRRRRDGEFLECFEVFGHGRWYGTLRSEVESTLAAGHWVLLEIDVQGTLEVQKLFPDAITVFLHPGSVEELERRLRGRGTEPEDELQQAEHYTHVVINDRIDRAVDEICEILSRKLEATP